MAGLLGLETSYASRRMHLGYRRARLLSPMPGHGSGQDLLGHEFHYSTILSQPDNPLAEVVDADTAMAVLEEAGKVTAKDAEEAMNAVVAAIRRMEQAGELFLLVEEEELDSAAPAG